MTAGCTAKELARYRKAAKIIHRSTCGDPDWCNYPKNPPKSMQDLPGMELAERQRLARLRLTWYKHCQQAVNSENAAAELARKGLLA